MASRLHAPHLFVLSLLAAACTGTPAETTSEGATMSSTAGTDSASLTDGMSSTSAGSASTSMTSSTSMSTEATTTATTTTTTTTSASESDTKDPTCGFICPPDCGASGCGGDDCDLWAQDCPEGEKCSAWASDGGNSWNATRCVPVVPDPDQPGEPCKVEGSGVSGLDTCALGAMCWDVDPETLEGECVALCIGSVDAPECADPMAYCALSGDGVLILCLTTCDPLLQTCDDGEGCVYAGSEFTCVDLLEPTVGQGESCDFVNACELGLACIDSAFIPGCMGPGCCTAFCDLQDPGTCPDMLPCTPWYPEDPPEGYENLGICATPP